MRRADDGREALASCNGYLVEAVDGCVGSVETPLFSQDRSDPDYLVLRVPRPEGLLRPIVTTALVESVDPGRSLVRLRVTKKLIARLPEHLPLADGS